MTQYTNPHALLEDAHIACTDLKSLLIEENDSLRQHRIELVEKNLKDKRKLSLKLENVLNNVKKNKEHLADDTQTLSYVKSLQEEIDSFQNMARQNLTLLQAAHQTRADFIDMVRLAVSAEQPKSTTYNNEGTVSDTSHSPPLVNKEI